MSDTEAERPSGIIRVLGAPKRDGEASRESRVRKEALTFESVTGGFVPPATRHGIKPFDPSGDWLFKGWKAGVYHADQTICRSSLLDRSHTSVTVPYEPDELAAFEPKYVAGDAVYGGLLFRHFGHFLLEATNRLWWPIAEHFDGPVVFQAVGRKEKEPDFIFEFFSLLGIKERILIAHDEGYRFDRVIVPQRSFVIRKYWHEEFRVPFLAAGAAAENSQPRAQFADAAGLYLSRTRYDFRRSLGEERLQRAFARNGFTVAHTETLPLAQQILLARHHSTIAGIQGSAFHNILFADSPREAVYICRDYDVNANYFMIDEMMRNSATYIYNGVAKEALAPRADRDLVGEEYRKDIVLDVEKVLWLLEQPGIISRGWTRRGV